MPIQECACFTRDQLKRPGGVLFDPPSTSKETDAKSWSNAQGKLQDLLSTGDSNEKWVMCLIQTRSTRAWDKKAGSFVFKPSEDYLIAAYLCDNAALVKYKPGTVLQLWYKQQISFTKVISDKSSTSEQFGHIRTEGYVKQAKLNQFFGMQEGVNDPHFTKIWQACPKATNLSVCGVLTMVHRKLNMYKTESEALGTVLDDMANKEKYGWRQHQTKKKFLFF